MKPLKTKLQKTGYVIGIALSAFVLGTLLQFAKAWSEPTVAPPNAEIGAPINTSANYQDKSGAIGSDTGFTTAGSVSAAGAVQGSTLCIGSDCRTAWPTSVGDNMGDEIATQDMNMSGYSIQNANQVNATGSMSAPIYYDSNNTGYYVQPSQTSNLWLANIYDITSTWMATENAYADSLDMEGGNVISVNGLYANDFIDSSNESYYLVPHGTSVLNQADVNTIRFSDGTTQTTAPNNSCTCTGTNTSLTVGTSACWTSYIGGNSQYPHCGQMCTPKGWESMAPCGNFY